MNTDTINTALEDYIHREKPDWTPQPRDYLWASQRRVCLRRSVLECTTPEAVEPWSAETKARMLRGSQREVDLTIMLTRAGQNSQPGFTLEQQQMAVRLNGRTGHVVISGKVDGQLKWAQYGGPWPFEIKSWSQYLTDNINGFGDVFANPWTWSGAHQILAYLYGTDSPTGLLILDRPGLPKLIRVDLEDYLDEMEAFLADAEKAQRHIRARTLPDYHPDATVCQACPLFGASCNPPTAFDGADIITDPDFVQMMEDWQAGEGQAKDWGKLDKVIKARLRGKPMTIVGEWMVTGRWGKQTTYDFPDEDTKRKYQVTNPEGRFKLTVRKLEVGD